MPRNVKTDFDEAKRLYVTEGMTYAAIGAKLGCSPQNLNARGRAEDWKGQRIAFTQMVARRGYESIAAGVAIQQSAIREEAIAVARATLRKYANDIMSGQVAVSAKDAALMIELLVRELAPEGFREDHGAPIVVSGKTPDAEQLRRVVEAARGQVSVEPSLGAPALGRTTRTGPN